MTPELRELYEPMLERDGAAIAEAARSFTRRRGDEALFHAVSRFAVLAFNPSQHGKHALLAVVAAWDLRERCGGSWSELLIECARYAADARLPWSEPPLLDPPPLGADPAPRFDEAADAIRRGERPLAERWLAGAIASPELPRDFFRLAALDLRDFGHPFAVAIAAWKLSRLQDRHPSYPTLRTAVHEWCARREDGPPPPRSTPPAPDEQIARALVERMAREGGSLDALHDLALFDAALQADELGADRATTDAVRAAVDPHGSPGASPDFPPPSGTLVYPLARDYAGLLEAHAIALRLKRRFPSLPADRLVAAAEYNLGASSFDQWSFP